MTQDTNSSETIKWEGRAVLVSASNDPTVLLAFDVRVFDGVISWFDLIRRRNMTIGRVTRDDGEAFHFERAEPDAGILGTYRLQPLTLDLFRTEVKPQMTIDLDFDTEREMTEFFLREAGYSDD